MEMLNETSDNGCRNILMDHFIRASSKDKKAEVSCEPYLIFSCLYAFFTGKSLGIKLNLGNEQDVIKYLAEKLDLPTEFFEVLHIFYTNNTLLYT